MPQAASPIGVFDSGAGGISVLRALVAELPEERFLYFGDSANTPYGEKPLEWVRARSHELACALLDQGAKAIVVACNTATSAAAEMLRAEFPDVPVIGVEPALKPAALTLPGGRILVMATPMTLRLEKFQHLADTWSAGCTVVPVACEGLAARIEQGNLEAPDLLDLLERLIGAWRGQVDGIVLGCTHYPFIAGAIRRVMGEVPLFDGAQGTARHVRHVLEGRGLLATSPAENTTEMQVVQNGSFTRMGWRESEVLHEFWHESEVLHNAGRVKPQFCATRDAQAAQAPATQAAQAPAAQPAQAAQAPAAPQEGRVSFATSSPDPRELALYRQLFAQ